MRGITEDSAVISCRARTPSLCAAALLVRLGEIIVILAREKTLVSYRGTLLYTYYYFIHIAINTYFNEVKVLTH